MARLRPPVVNARRRLTMAILVLAAAFGRASAQETARRAQVHHLSLTVAAGDSAWRATDLEIEEGDLLTIRASGLITIGRFARDVDPRGVPVGGSAALGTVYLEYRIGESAAAPVGTTMATIATRSGTLGLHVRDTRYDDNAGAFTVDVIAVPGALIPDVRQPGETEIAPSSEIVEYLQSFLKMFATAEEAYFADHARYAARVSDLAVQLPAGVIVQGLLLGERGTGWSIIVRHENLPRIRCATATNMVNPLDSSAAELQAVCK